MGPDENSQSQPSALHGAAQEPHAGSFAQRGSAQKPIAGSHALLGSAQKPIAGSSFQQQPREQVEDKAAQSEPSNLAAETDRYHAHDDVLLL